MFVYLFVGVWACLVTVGAGWGAYTWKRSEKSGEHQAPVVALAPVKPKLVSVPVIADGKVVGYVAAQMVFHVNAVMLKAMKMKPEDALIDEAFTALYSQPTIDFRNLQKQDLPALSKAIKENVNKRFKADFVDSVMFHELNYIARDQVRGG